MHMGVVRGGLDENVAQHNYSKRDMNEHAT